MSFLTLFFIGAGGFIGAILRSLSGFLFLKSPVFLGVPLATLFVNIVGSFLIGVFLSSPYVLNRPELKGFLTAGIMGGLTTFSTFSFDNVTLISDKMWLYAALNITLNVILGFCACFLGTLMPKLFN